MSSLRRILAVGLPTAGLTVFTALTLGAPASAAAVDQLAYPAAAATTPAATNDDRTDGGYGTASPDAVDEPTDTPTRGNNGYGTPSPTASSPTPTASTDTVPPGVSPSSVPPSTPAAAATTPGGGVSAGHLPVTGAPMGTLASVGGLLVAAGVGSVWYTRRRRSA